MKIAIHSGGSWNSKWRDYCLKQNIPHQELNCYDSDIIKKLRENGITHLMWHFNHSIHKDLLMARNVLYSAKKMGIKIYPDFDTCWHFDDKIAQKYLLESVGAPVVPSWAFYDLEEALKWLKKEAQFPLVAKLRGGAGSYNVKLINDFSEAKRYAQKMFINGVNPSPTYVVDVKNRLSVAINKDSKAAILKKFLATPKRLLKSLNNRNTFPKEKGYVYFQKFIPGNTHDLRVSVIRDRAWAGHRQVRKNDFRASGSGVFDSDQSKVPLDVIEQSIQLAARLNMQSIAFDYVKDRADKYYIVEISYGFGSKTVQNAGGFWDENKTFHEGSFSPDVVILEDFISNRI